MSSAPLSSNTQPAMDLELNENDLPTYKQMVERLGEYKREYAKSELNRAKSTIISVLKDHKPQFPSIDIKISPPIDKSLYSIIESWLATKGYKSVKCVYDIGTRESDGLDACTRLYIHLTE